jgi:hypothetical protein
MVVLVLAKDALLTPEEVVRVAAAAAAAAPDRVPEQPGRQPRGRSERGHVVDKR